MNAETADAVAPTNHKWYIVHAYSNFEKKVKEAILDQARNQGLEDQFSEVLVPTEDVVEIRRGRKINTERKFFPGYVLVKMNLTDEAYHLIKNTPKVTGFLGSGAKPLPDADGKSLRPLLDGSADILHLHVFAGQTNRVEHPTGAGGDGGLLDYMMVASKAFDWDLVSDGRFKLVRDRHASRTLLFDLDNDPLEQVDLSDSRPDMVKTLDAVLDRELERPIPKGTA